MPPTKGLGSMSGHEYRGDAGKLRTTYGTLARPAIPSPPA